MDLLQQLDPNELWDTLQTLILTYGLNLLGAIVILLVGYWLSKAARRLVSRALGKTRTDQSLIRFASSIVYYALLAFTIVAALEQLGVTTTSFVAILGAAGLAIGLAMEGALSNFAAGVLLLFFRPFKVGDHVEVADHFGQTESIQVFHTVLVTRDNKTVTIPNSQVTGAPIVNYSKKGLIRLDMVFGIGYEDDLLRAKEILQEIVTGHDKVLADPPPKVAVLELADSSVNFAVRPYVRPDDYWSTALDLPEQVKLRFDEEGISIPFPQRDVHLFQES